MENHAIHELMGITMDKIRELAATNTIIGDPIKTDDGTVILPVSKVTFGVAGGGSDFADKSSKVHFGGGSGAGVTLAPVAFLVIKDGSVRTIQLSAENAAVERAITMIPELVDRLSALLRKEKKSIAAEAPKAETEQA